MFGLVQSQHVAMYLTDSEVKFVQFLLLIALVSFTILIFHIILGVVAWWKLYEKLGIEGWKSVVPILSSYELIRLFYGKGWYVLWMFVPIVNIYFSFGIMNRLGQAFHKSLAWRIILLMLFPLIGMFILGFSDDVYDENVKF